MTIKQVISLTLVSVMLLLTNASLAGEPGDGGIKQKDAIGTEKSTLQEKQVFRPLRVACDSLDDFMEAGFTEAYPNIAVQHKPASGDDAIALFAEQINLQSDEIDIFELPIGSTTQNMIDKGDYYPLNQDESIREKMDAYRPFFRQIVIKDNDIAAIPRMAQQYTLAYSEFALAQLGLGAADMPSTFLELMDFLLTWNERVGDVARQAGVTPFGIPNEQVKVELLMMLMDQYYALMAQNASAIPLYEVDMANLLDKLSRVCATIPEGTVDEHHANSKERFGHIKVHNQRSYLFSVSGSFHPGRRSFVPYESVADFVPLALTLPSQDTPVLFFEGTLFIVNPYSSQKEQAIQWLAFYMNHLPAKEAAVFDRNALPLKSELYIGMKDYYASEIEKLTPQIEAAEGATKSNLEEQLQMKQDKLRELAQIEWDVPAQALEDYEEIFVQSTVLWNDPCKYADAFNPTYRKYLTEGMPGEAVAQAFFAIHEMLLKESR